MRKRWIVPTAVTALLVAGAGFWIYNLTVTNGRLMNYLNSKYQRAFYDLVARTENVEVLLAKAAVANDPRNRSAIFSDLWLQANAAQENLSQLPVSGVVLGRTSKFLTQVGDYSRSLVQKVAAGGQLSKADLDTLSRLRSQANTLDSDLLRIHDRISTGQVRLSELTRTSRQGLSSTGNKMMDSDFNSMNQHLRGLPTLLYDGPFSDRAQAAKKPALAGPNVDQARAQSIAESFLDKKGVGYMVQTRSQVRGLMPGYRFVFTSSRARPADQVTVDVTKTGGKVAMLLDSRAPGKPTLNRSQALAKAVAYLNSHGYTNMVPTYYKDQNGMFIGNFVARENGILVYPDQVKVSVAMDNGQVVGFDALKYLANHKPRNLGPAKITAGEARQKVNPDLKVQQVRQVIIPTDSGGEKLAYEIKGTLNKDTFLVYVDAMTGQEEKILKLVPSARGTLAI